LGSARLGADARRQAARYAWVEQAQRYVAIVEKLMAR
jgi:hypothetical protein